MSGYTTKTTRRFSDKVFAALAGIEAMLAFVPEHARLVYAPLRPQGAVGVLTPDKPSGVR